MNVGVTLDNPLRLADQWAFSVARNSHFNHNHRSRSFSGSMSLPYGYWQVGYHYAWSDFFQAIPFNQATYRYQGDSQTHRLSANRTLFRDGTRKFGIDIGLTRRRTENRLAGERLAVSSPTISSLSFGGNYSAVLGQGYLTFNPTISHGLSILGATADDPQHRDLPRSKFRKFSLSTSYFHPLVSSLSYLASAYGQTTPDNLYSSERISVGGQYSVRGFREQYLTGNRGAYWRNELSWQPGSGDLTLFGAMDSGWVQGRAGRIDGGNVTGAAVGAMGGALNGFDSVTGWNKDAAGKPLNPKDVKLPHLSNGDWSKVAQRVAGQSIISSSLNTAINGGSFRDNLTNALLSNIGGQLNAEGANLIGENGQVLGVPGKVLSHAVVAGVAAEIGRGDGKGAAAGAMAAELAGVIMQSSLFEPANLNEKERQLRRLHEALNGNETKEQTARVIGALTGALITHTPEGAYSAADSAQTVYRYNMTDHMLMQYARDNQMDILAADKGDVAAAKRVVARREAAVMAAAVGGGGLVIAAGGITLVGAAPELVLAARLAIAGCKTNPALCLNQAGIYAADIVAPEAIIGAGAVTTGSTLILGKSEGSAKKLAQQLVKTSDELYKTKSLNTQPVADFIKSEATAGANLSTKTADYLHEIQKTNIDQLVKLFDKKQPNNRLSVFGKQFKQVLGEGGSDRKGKTKVFSSQSLTEREIFDFAQSLIGGGSLKEVMTPRGKVYFAKSGNMTINLRNYSNSSEETQARWTIDIIGNERIKDAAGIASNKYELKFR